jgi:hypothetical protein
MKQRSDFSCSSGWEVGLYVEKIIMGGRLSSMLMWYIASSSDLAQDELTGMRLIERKYPGLLHQLSVD